LGGINCQCVDEVECTEAQGKVMHWLEVPDYLPFSRPSVARARARAGENTRPARASQRECFRHHRHLSGSAGKGRASHAHFRRAWPHSIYDCHRVPPSGAGHIVHL
jgi:hypothetical protein